MSFSIEDEEILKKFNKTWIKVKSIISKNFNGNPLLNHKYLKTKIKSYKGRVTTNFNSKVAKKRSE